VTGTRSPAETDAMLPLWRAIVVFRGGAMLVAIGAFWLDREVYPSFAAAVGLLAAMAVWTVISSIVYLRPGGQNARAAVIDLAATLALLSATVLVQPWPALQTTAPILASVWVAGPVLALAAALGRDGGLAGALAVGGALIALRQRIGDQELFNLTLLVISGVTFGYVATRIRATAQQLHVALAAEMAAVERERLARTIHDGVLQVLAAVQRRGPALGPDGAELAALAADQEIALRVLMSRQPPAGEGRSDLTSALRPAATARIEVVAPVDPVWLPSPVVDELVAVVREALTNVERHAGPGARAWVVVEDLGTSISLSVRDNGAGIEAGRLDRAVADGRLGVAASIRGRVHDLGGRVALTTAAGDGTEWEITMPKEPPAGHGAALALRRSR